MECKSTIKCNNYIVKGENGTVKPGYKHIGYKHILAYKHIILGPEAMLIARFDCSAVEVHGSRAIRERQVTTSRELTLSRRLSNIKNILKTNKLQTTVENR